MEKFKEVIFLEDLIFEFGEGTSLERILGFFREKMPNVSDSNLLKIIRIHPRHCGCCMYAVIHKIPADQSEDLEDDDFYEKWHLTDDSVKVNGEPLSAKVIKRYADQEPYLQTKAK